MNLANANLAAKGGTHMERFDDFSSVVKNYQSLVWAVAYSITGDASLSEDVAQETFLAAWNQQADIRDLGKFKSYLATIARNLGRKAIRGSNHEVADRDGTSEAGEAIDTRGPLDEVLKREQLSQVAIALEKMPLPSREAFVLFYTDGQSVARVADQLELSKSAVKQRLFRARESLKESLETTLSNAITAGIPGKAFAAATMTLILAQGTVASAAASHASVSDVLGSETLAKTQELPTSTYTISGKIVGGAVLAASVAVAVLLAQATMSTDKGTQDTKTGGQPTASSSAFPQDSPLLTPRAPRQLKAAKIQAPVAAQTADEGLLTSRIVENWPGADGDGDGLLSENEILVLRDTQEDELTKQILKHWQDVPCECGADPAHAPYGVTCAFVGQADDGQAQEGFAPYFLFELRGLYEEELEVGLDMNATEWVASKVATAQKEKVCYEITARLHDEVHALRANAKAAPLPWVASVTFQDKEALRFPPPKELRKELVNVTNQSEAAEVAERWGVKLEVLANESGHAEDPRYIPVTFNQSDIVDWDQLPPAIQVAIEAAKNAAKDK